MDTRIRNIVVGVATLTEDDPVGRAEGQDPVLAPAVELARRLGATLHVAHVFELPDPVLAAYATYVPYFDPGFRDVFASGLRARLERQVHALGYDDVRCHAVEGSAGRSLCELAERVHAELVVVGATRRGRVWRNLLGTTAERVIRGSRVPVLVMHQPFAADVRRLLLTTDLSPLSGAVLDRGVDTARALFGPGLETRAVLVVWLDGMIAPPLEPDALARAADSELRRFLDARPGGRRVEGAVRFGEVPREVVREAQEWGADLMVLGTHGRGGMSRLLLGSTAAAILRGADCNVLVIPPAPVRAEAAEPAPAREPTLAARAIPALVV